MARCLALLALVAPVAVEAGPFHVPEPEVNEHDSVRAESAVATVTSAKDCFLYIQNAGFEEVYGVLFGPVNPIYPTETYSYTTVPDWVSSCCARESTLPATVVISSGSLPWGSVASFPSLHPNKYYVGLQFATASIGQAVEHQRGKHYLLTVVAQSRPGNPGRLRVVVGTSSSTSPDSSIDWCMTNAWETYSFCYKAAKEDLTVTFMNSLPCPGQDSTVFVDNVKICEVEPTDSRCSVSSDACAIDCVVNPV